MPTLTLRTDTMFQACGKLIKNAEPTVMPPVNVHPVSVVQGPTVIDSKSLSAYALKAVMKPVRSLALIAVAGMVA